MQMRSRSVREDVNDHTHRLHANRGRVAGEFLCECGNDECHSFVWLTLREFEGLRAGGFTVSSHRDDTPPTLLPAA